MARRVHSAMAITAGRPALLAMLAFMLACTSAAAQISTDTSLATGSGLLERPARLRIESRPLAAALAELSTRSGVALAYSPSLIPGGVRVSCSCERSTVRDALVTLLDGTGFTFFEVDGQVVLRPRIPPRSAQGDTPPASNAGNGGRMEGRPPAILDQVVVTGTVGDQERRAQGAEVASLNAADAVRRSPAANIPELLAGVLPGISVTRASGATGGSSLIRVRGVSSIALSNEPLIFVDGVRLDYRNVTVDGAANDISTLTDLAPYDIARIEVVKGPAAATLYGSDASAGVIQIITNRGTIGEEGFRQSVSAQYGRLDPNWIPPTNFARCTDADTASSGPSVLCRGKALGTLVSDNPLVREGILRDGSVGSIRWSGSGGGERHGYFLAYGYRDETGILPQNSLEQHNARANFDFVPRGDFSIQTGLGIARDVNNQAGLGDRAYNMFLALYGSPLTVGRAADGWLVPHRTGIAFRNIANEFTTLRVTPTVRITHTPTEWLTHRLIVGADISHLTYHHFLPRNDEGWFQATDNTGFVREQRGEFVTYTLDYLANLKQSFGHNDRWTSNLSFGTQAIAHSTDNVVAVGYGLTSNSANSIGAAARVSASGAGSEQRSLGVLGQWQLGFRDRLFAQVGARVDRSSSFGSDAPSFFLPKVGVSYVISDEQFWRRHATFVSAFRLRAAYGATGRVPEPGASRETYLAVPAVIAPGISGPSVIPLNPGNPDLRAERGTELEAGFDAELGDGRAGVSFTVFDKVSRDLILQRPLPPSEGYAAGPFVNVGRVVNRGVEITTHAALVRSPAVAWNVQVGLNTLHNELESLGGVPPIVVGSGALVQFREGSPLGSYYGRRIVDVDSAGGRAIVSDTALFLGSPIPSFEGSLQSDLTIFGKLRLSALLTAKTGQSNFDFDSWFRERTIGNTRRYQEMDLLPMKERLQRFGPFVTSDGATVSSLAVYDGYVQSAKYLRLRELSLTLDVTPDWPGMGWTDHAALTLGATNLALWTSFGGVDPEVTNNIPSPGDLVRGYAGGMPPEPRQFYVRLAVRF